MVCHHLTKFGSHKYCSSRDIMATWSEGHAMLCIGTCQSKFGGQRNSGIRDIIIFVCQVTFQDHVIKAFYDFIVRSPSKFGGHRHYASGNIMFLLSRDLAGQRDESVI